MNKTIIIGMCILLISLVGCIDKKECEEIVKKDYQYDNPICVGGLSGGRSYDCSCVKNVCKENSCMQQDRVNFDIK